MTLQLQTKVNKKYEARDLLEKELLNYHSSLKEAIEAKNRSVRVENLVEKCKGVFENMISKNEVFTNIAKTCQDTRNLSINFGVYLNLIT